MIKKKIRILKLEVFNELTGIDFCIICYDNLLFNVYGKGLPKILFKIQLFLYMIQRE